jgi:hypothetical protein
MCSVGREGAGGEVVHNDPVSPITRNVIDRFLEK